MIRCYIAIGSNLAQPVQQARLAIECLRELPQSELVAVSSLYRSAPMGPQDQPDYINAVAELHTSLAPLELLDATQKIELEQGRQRKDERWGPRTLDLDILLYGDQVIDHPRLTVPHYGMKEREFVLYPLAEIAAELTLPCGSRIQDLLINCPQNGLVIHSPA